MDAQLPSIVGFPAFARLHPEKPALVIEPSGSVITYGELDRHANRRAHALRRLGLEPGDCIALCLPNGVEIVAGILAAQRVGLYYTLIPAAASASDIAYVCADSGARLLILAPEALSPELEAGMPSCCKTMVSNAQSAEGGSWDCLVALMPDDLPANPRPGMEMIYSSGSTGRPKGIRRDFQCKTWGEVDARNVGALRWLRASSNSVYLSTSPLYHSAPYRFLLAFLDGGATTVLMERFDAALALKLIDREACTHSLWVPTMFQRMLALDAQTRATYRGHSMTHAFHGAAPCPVHIKHAMIAWWGPIIYEYYSGTEGIGRTFIDSAEWLQHPGSVGKPNGCIVHILDDQGRELATGETGNIFFESDVTFDYWNAPDKTAQSRSPQGWRTYGDIGHVDEAGYLYLTDRLGFMVISGGVNLYPREIEDNLLTHPRVLDAAVFGVPDDDLGERLVAVVQLREDGAGDDALGEQLREHCRQLGGSIKTPRLIRFCAEFPRLDTGKVQKQQLRARVLEEPKPRAATAVLNFGPVGSTPMR